MADNVPTGRELEALKVLWSRGKATVREIYQEMRPPDGKGGPCLYDSAQPIASPCEQKGLVGHTVAGKAYTYHPLVQRESTFRKLAGGFLDQVFDGALGEYVARALQSRRHSLHELEELERMIGEAKKSVRISAKAESGGGR